MKLNEITSVKHKIRIAKDFVKWACDKLGISEIPEIQYSNDKDQVRSKRTFGTTLPSGKIWVYVGERNTADMLRTLVHELVHVRQFKMGKAHEQMSEKERLSVEDEANALAGRMMRDYGKINVEIYEGRTGSIQHEVADSLPQAYVIPGLNSSNPYEQYKFGTAIAAARGKKARDLDGIVPFVDHRLRRDWADNEVVISFDPHIEEIIDAALKDAGIKGGKRRIGIKGSYEQQDVGKTSPLRPFKGYKR